LVNIIGGIGEAGKPLEDAFGSLTRGGRESGKSGGGFMERESRVEGRGFDVVTSLQRNRAGALSRLVGLSLGP
jgi:hypothetical protein